MSGLGVDRIFEHRLARLINGGARRPLARGRRGVEREALRVDPVSGRVARTPHPEGLGAALTHPHITTDYSEALIELVTPTFEDNAALCAYLDDLHRFVYAHIDGELLWATSMPCAIDGEDEIPIARYGRSHAGFFKTVYRRGLRTRYGGIMQAIAGVHFNYSLPVDFWPVYADVLESRDTGSGFVSRCYFDLLRNFRRYGWLVPLLFGGSPALDASFLAGRGAGGLEARPGGTLFGRDATSLRMSSIGYRNRAGAGAGVDVSVNALEAYLGDLKRAMRSVHPPFAALGVCVAGEYRQLNDRLLQIENEYYSSIRPKRAPLAGEGTAHALARAGVEYVEVRALDVDWRAPGGVAPATLHVLEALLILCLLRDSPAIESAEQAALDDNFEQIASRGREAGLALRRGHRDVPALAWAAELLESLEGICELLDAGDGARPYARALAAQRDALRQPQLLPAALQLRALEDGGLPFQEFGRQLAEAHRAELDPSRLSTARRWEFAAEAEESLAAQEAAEAADRGGFDEYLRDRLARQLDFAPR